MLDIKSKLVLKILLKECPNGAYKVVESSDLISALPARYRVDSDGLENILNYLERQDCISIKYDDDGVFCLCVLPYGYELCENEGKSNKKKEQKRSFSMFFYILTAFFALLGGFLGGLICLLIK